jgi:hypothetical protein
MVRQLLGVGVALLTLAVGACSSAPIDSTEQGATESELGSVNLPLTTTVGDAMYRLNLAAFTITGPALAKPLLVKPPADAPAIYNQALPVGSYSIQLEKGWVLEKKTSADKAYAAVAAQLVTPNPLAFEVTGKRAADAFFGFATVSGDVSLGKGSVDIRIGVQDCTAYDTYLAALGELTADCLGTVDPRLFAVNRDGILTPRFDKCPNDPSRLTAIRQLLSLQYRTARLPFAKQCMGGRFEVAQQKLAQDGLVDVCPTWSRKQVINPPDDKIISQVLDLGLPQLPADDTGKPPAGLALLKVNSFYAVTSATPAAQKCGTPAECAAVCAAAFPGFVVSTQDQIQVRVDPTAWLIDTTYNSATADPYMRPGYYHPMSYYGALPGALFGEYARFEPCGPGGACNPEFCSYYAGGHIKTLLQKDCLDDADIDTCVSYCGPKLP